MNPAPNGDARGSQRVAPIQEAANHTVVCGQGHLFGVDDTEDPRERAIVIYFLDIWINEFPD